MCDKLVANHEVFNEWSPHGYLTQHCEDIAASVFGFFPVLTVSENKFIEALGGYQFLQSMAVVEAVDFCHSLTNNEARLVGAEPFLTEVCVKSSMEYFARRSAQPPPRADSGGFGARACRGRNRGRGRQGQL